MTEFNNEQMIIALLITDEKSIEEAKRIAKIVVEERIINNENDDYLCASFFEEEESETAKLEKYVSKLEEKQKEEVRKNGKINELFNKLFKIDATYSEAIEFCNEKINTAKAIIKKCEAKNYKKTNGSVFVGSEMEGDTFSYNYINEKRKTNKIKNANADIEEWETFKTRIEEI